MTTFTHGELVRTSDGYYGIVLEHRSAYPVVRVFLGNGLDTSYLPAELELLPLPNSTAPHTFCEVLRSV